MLRSTMNSLIIDSVIGVCAIDSLTFRANELRSGGLHTHQVYGGQLVAQSICAASKTMTTSTDKRYMHSFHSHFLLPGDARVPIFYKVEHLRDGFSTSARLVKAIQNERTIFAAQMSFCSDKIPSATTTYTHQGPMPDVVGPDQLIDAKTVLQDVLTRNDERLNDADRTYIRYRIENLPEMFEMRPVNRAAFERMQPMPADYLVWLRYDDAIPMVHHLLAAYVSDSPMISTSLLPHIKRDRNVYRDLHMLSLDHAIWIHRPNFRIDDWILYQLHSTIADNNRALIEGKFWTKDGRHVMSTMQEGLIKPKSGI